MHVSIESALLYFGTPVVVVSSLNEDSTTNLAPISSAWCLGWSCMIGLDATSKTTENLKRHAELVLNLASSANVTQVDHLALLTGSAKVPIHKKMLGYKSEKDKFNTAGLTPTTSEEVTPDRIQEFPIQMEGRVVNMHRFAAEDRKMAIPTVAVEIQILRIHGEESILKEENKDDIDPDKWHPLIMNFRQFYSTDERLHSSRLADGAEDRYAPWKAKGMKKVITNQVLKHANRKHET